MYNMRYKIIYIFTISVFCSLSACSDKESSEKNPLISEDTSSAEMSYNTSSSKVDFSSSSGKLSSSKDKLSSSLNLSSSSKDKVSSSSNQSSSSKDKVSSSSNKSSSSKDESSSSSEDSSSSKNVSSSSSEKTSSSKNVSSSSSEKSSSSKDEPSSSSEKLSSNKDESSSSSEKSSSSSLGIPFEIYDCSKYQCITTIHLNPNIKYGEYLDDRPAQNKVYRTVKIGEQEWMAQNLNYAKAGSICPLEEDSLCNLYGRLYKWDDAINACPSGWRLPNADDYKNLSDYVESNSNGLPVGTCLKYGENNIWGFSGVFAGFRTRIGADSEYGIYGYFWTSTEAEDKAKGRILVKNKDYLGYVTEYKEAMLSVRCIKD